MITVAIIAVLALIAVPAFFSQSRKSKASSETASMFAELSTKEEQYKIDAALGVYLSATAWPASPSAQLQNILPLPAAWSTLHITPPETRVYCSYAITTGPQATAPSAPAPFHMASDGTDPTPIASWYFIVATCDMDGSPTVNSRYFISSMDTRIQVDKPGN